ncbi:MAG TPA: hypothetical protein VF169_22530 [Albitalea sp.]|uniref:hypothetical protein n=1 Tax=Piscinibacter sp. TaxID=1903157 RepID=UPI002ECFD78E
MKSAIACGLAALIAAGPAMAAAKPAKPVTKSTRKAGPPPLPEATPEQLEAAQRVFYGHYECELKQVIDIDADPKNAGYVEVRHAKARYLMKPVLSTTGAVRLEDVKGRTLMVQIAAKSMLMDVKAGRRLVDECVSPQQRELGETAARAKAAEEAASAASAGDAASAPPAASAASDAASSVR